MPSSILPTSGITISIHHRAATGSEKEAIPAILAIGLAAPINPNLVDCCCTFSALDRELWGWCDFPGKRVL
ncbi:hypothetical protein Tco_0991192 [Tanacetum coccineum]|uniref:Uncharacterized protein n=1 Tax=Tanacetum coccineum TaxID=301880 RepID=A0ABQ5EZC2_9ASTR